MGIELNPIKDFITGAADIIDRFITTPDEKAEAKKQLSEMGERAEERVQKSVESARDAYVAEFKYGSHTTWFDSFVDGVNRLIRPVVTLGLLAGVFGAFDIPKDIDPRIWDMLAIALFFWFGGRLLAKDGGGSAIKTVVSKFTKGKGD